MLNGIASIYGKDIVIDNQTGDRLIVIATVPNTVDVTKITNDTTPHQSQSQWVLGPIANTEESLPPSTYHIPANHRLLMRVPATDVTQKTPVGLVTYQFSKCITFGINTNQMIGTLTVNATYDGAPVKALKSGAQKPIVVPITASGSFTDDESGGCAEYEISIDNNKVSVAAIEGCQKDKRSSLKHENYEITPLDND